MAEPTITESYEQATKDYKDAKKSWMLVGILIIGAAAFDVMRKKRR